MNKKEQKELVEAAVFALKEAQSWVDDQLQGTASYEDACAELEPARQVIRKYGGDV